MPWAPTFWRSLLGLSSQPYGELAPLLSHVPLLLSRSASARSQFLDPVTVTALFSGQAVGFPPSARWRESLQLAVVVKIADGAEAYSALTQFFLYQKEETDTYLPTGSALAASRLWSHAGVSRQELRSLPWNGGHLGQRQWARLATRIQTDAPDICEVVVQKVCNGSGNPDEHAFLPVSS